MPRKVERTRNDGTWTEAKYWGHIRSALRNAFRYWKPLQNAIKAAKVGTQYRCAHCKNLCPRKEMQSDHVVPCGSLRSLDDVAGFIERLTQEGAEAYQALCKSCHQIKTNEERKKK